MKTEKEPKMIICKHCGTEIAKSAKSCPKCGGKNKKPIYKRWWFILLTVFLVLFVIFIAGSGNQYKVSDDAKNMSEKDYKAECVKVDYKDISREPDKYIGKKVRFTGQVEQVIFDSESGESEYRVNVTKDEYDIYDDTVYVYYNYGENKKWIEEDIVTMYGEMSGTVTYTTVLGAEVTIPAVTVIYAKIK